MRFNKRLFSVILFFSLFTLQLNAQEQLGLKLENYSGINSVLFNPTYSVTSPFRWDVNVVSAGISFDNNYAYVQNESAFSFLNNDKPMKARPDINTEVDDPNDFLIIDFYDGNNKKQGSFLATVMGPSFMLNLQSGWSVGLFTNSRVAGSARKVPPALNYYRFDGQEFNESFAVDPFKAAGMAWTELGFNVAKQVPTASGTMVFGANLKFMSGHEGFYINNKSEFDLSKLRGDTLSFQSIDLEYAYTDSNIDADNVEVKRNGSGVGFDFGFSYVEGDLHNYDWKVGAALIDLGRIKFFNNASQHQINRNTQFDINTSDFDDLSTFDGQVNLLSLQALGDSLASETDQLFRIATPAALTAFGDYHLTKRVYINASLVQNIPTYKNAVSRDNILAITPRYERRWFGAMLPVSLYNYRKLRVGAALRLGFLTIGSEHLASLFKQDEFTGTDFYVGVKINPFDLGGGGKGRGGSGKGNVRCYDF